MLRQCRMTDGVNKRRTFAIANIRQEQFEDIAMTECEEAEITCGDTQAQRKSGRVSFDGDGRSVWEWQTATGVFTRNVTTDELVRLSQVELSIVEPAELFGETGSHMGLCMPASARRAVQRKASEGIASRLFRRLTR